MRKHHNDISETTEVSALCSNGYFAFSVYYQQSAIWRRGCRSRGVTWHSWPRGCMWVSSWHYICFTISDELYFFSSYFQFHLWQKWMYNTDIGRNTQAPYTLWNFCFVNREPRGDGSSCHSLRKGRGHQAHLHQGMGPLYRIRPSQTLQQGNSQTIKLVGLFWMQICNLPNVQHSNACTSVWNTDFLFT